MNWSNSTRAKANPNPGKCWGSLTRCLGYCERNARPGKLTCWHHQVAERNAQKIKAQKDTEATKEPR